MKNIFLAFQSCHEICIPNYTKYSMAHLYVILHGKSYILKETSFLYPLYKAA